MANISALHRQSYNQRVDGLVLALSIVLTGTLVGIYFEVAWLIFYLMPVLTCLLLLLPCVRNSGKHSGASTVVALFSGIMLAIYVSIGWAESTDALLLGMPAGGALFLYVLWPYTVIGGGLAYAYCYQYWLKHSDLGPES